LLEDSGYLARAAFLIDKIMSFTGLHGKSFIPLILGFGCAVPAIYATRTLENERDRITTSLLVPLMSCSARLPVYVVFGLAFFPRHAGLLITGLYLTGIIVAMGIGSIFSRTILKSSPDRLFVLELPPYRLPPFKGLLIHTWHKSKEFVHKAGSGRIKDLREEINTTSNLSYTFEESSQTRKKITKNDVVFDRYYR
jgi:ferrous iron transport protein B